MVLLILIQRGYEAALVAPVESSGTDFFAGR
jgi:hypothetical protein